MTAHINPEQIRALTEAQTLACDAVLECASLLATQSAALVAASAMADMAAVEACLWACKHILTTAITNWREAVPALPRDDGGDA